ncbi:11810_t:CDS:10 [Acaulospora colombiana]|uniref:11810_t:CDS:1 n=1 Tax=Acaulospora colombiana TaxID=27376 RepID=A0ACA9LGK3_9GLOM|nr:11810_t:CDS:10 [Acaulospora colombiana]
MKSNGQSDIVRHFGLQLIENSARFHWNEYDQSEKDQIKQYVVELIQQVDLRDSLTCIVGSSSALQARYPDGVKSNNSRAGELTIMQGEPDNEGWLMRWVRSLEQLLTEWQYQSQNQSPTLLVHEKLAVATINTISAHVEWIFAKSVVETKTVLALTNCLLSDCYGIKMEAIEGLSVALSRTYQTPEDRAFISEPFYEQDGVDLLIAVYGKIQPSRQVLLLEEHEYKFLKKFAEVVVEIGEKHICFRNNTLIPKQFPKYLELVYEISKHPSNVIASTTIAFWQSALRHPHISKGFNEQEELLLMLLELFAQRLKMLFQPEDADNEITYYIDMEGYSNEYRIFAQTLRTKFVDTIKAITQMKPISSFNWMVQKTQITNDLKNLLQMLLSLDYSDVVMTHRYLAALVSFVDILVIDSSLLFPVLQKYTVSPTTPYLPIPIQRLRSGAISTLIKFGTAMPDILMASGINLLSSVVNDMKQNGTYTKSAGIESVPGEMLEQYRVARSKVPLNEKLGSMDSRVDVSLWGKYVPTILSTTLALIRLLHQLWNVESWREMPIELQGILLLSQEEKANILGLSQKSPLTDLYIVRPYILNCSTPEILSGFLPQLLKYMDEKLSTEWAILTAKGILTSSTEEFNEIPNLDLTSDASDEILSEHLLRDLTRAYIVEREVLREFVGKTLLAAALQALNDGYHKEIHPVIISLITDLYIDLRPLSPIPYETLAQLLNMDHVRLQEFETSLSQATESKARKIIVRNFLEGITGLSTGEWFKVPDASSTIQNRRIAYGNYEKPRLGVLDAVDDPNEVGIERWFE